MIVDSDLQLRPDWEKHVGPDIGGISPDVSGWDQSNPPYMRFFAQGKAYSDWLAAIHRPILPNTGNLQLSFDLMVDSLAGTYAQALEFDTRLSIAGFNYNFSSQVNYAEGGKLQISDVKGNWVDSGAVPGKLPILMPIRFLYVYKFDTIKKTYSTVSVSIAGKKYLIPARLQNLAAQPLKWDDSCSLQVQLDIGALPGAFSHSMNNVDLGWF